MLSILLFIAVSIFSAVSAFQSFHPMESNMAARTTTATSPLFSSSSSSSSNESQQKRAIVVGGGPVGLATALTLSNPPHSYNVIVLEQTAQETGVKEYDPTKAYLYQVNQRGQVWTQRFPSVQRRLVERGSAVGSGMGNFIIVPGDPSVPIPEAGDTASQPEAKGGTGAQSYWVPRHVTVQLLEDAIEEQEESRKENIGSIQVLPGKKFDSMEVTDDGMLQVTVLDTITDEKRFTFSYKANLVVGADGMNSAVCTFLLFGHRKRMEEVRTESDYFLSLVIGSRLPGR